MPRAQDAAGPFEGGEQASDEARGGARGQAGRLRGRRLGDATRAEVEEAAAYYGKIAADTGFKQRWLAKVAAAAPKRGTVSDKLDAAALLRLQKEATA